MNQKSIRILALSAIVSSYLFAGGNVGNCPNNNGNFLVTSSSDANGADNTLRACIYRAGISGDEASVTFNADMEIILSNPIVFNGDFPLTLDGETHEITINGNHTSQLMIDNNSNKVTIKNFNAKNGLDDSDSTMGGGALYINSNGTFEITNVTFTDNNATGDNNGGAIYVDSRPAKDTTPSINITNSVFNHNGSSRFGASIYMEDNISINISNTQFTDNSTKKGAAALYMQKDSQAYISDSNFLRNKVTDNDNSASVIFAHTNSKLSIEDSNFRQNDSHVCCDSDGVAIITMSDSDTLSINRSEFTDNNSSVISSKIKNVIINNSLFKNNNNLDDFHTSLIFSNASVDINNSQIIHNNFYSYLLVTFQSDLNISNSKFNDNTDIDNNDEIGPMLFMIESNTTISNTEFDSNTNGVTALFNDGNNTIEFSSFTNNTSIAQIAIFSANLNLNNSTLSTNSDINGTIYTSDSNIIIDSATIYNNINTDSSTQSAGILNVSPYSTIDIANTILINNTINSVEKNSNYQLGDVIYSLIGSDVTATTLFANIQGDNPQLKPLEYNGGIGKTNALTSNSPAKNKGNTLLSTDQRGKTRDDNPDIGAYEYQGMSLSPIYYMLLF